MDIVTLAAARKGGGGGDVTKAYVDDHLALKADKSETAQYPISGTVSGDDISVTGTADANVQKLTVYGRSEVVEGEIVSIGDGGELNVRTIGKNLINIPPKTLSTANYLFNMPTFKYFKTGQYTFSFNFSGTVSGYYEVNVNGTAVKTKAIREGLNSATFTINQDFDTTSFLAFSQGVGTYSNFQLERNTTATAYESYISSSASLTTGLPLCGIPVTSGETYTDGDGVKWLADTADVEGVEKRCGVVDLGDLTWQKATSVVGAFYANASALGYKFAADVKAVCGKYEYIGTTKTVHANDKKFSLYFNFPATLTGREIYINDSDYVDASAEDFKASLAGIKLIYELATPTTTPLTPAEKSALLNLKTFDSTTNLSITDDPFVDFGYIKNTANGKAVEQAAENVIAQIPFIAGSWITDIPEMHRNIFRGQSLGSSVTAAQLAAIEDGSFTDLYIGDYWTINNVVWRIADIDHYLNKGVSYQLTAHHLVIMPDDDLYDIAMGSANYYSVRSTVLADAKTAVNAAFPDMVLPYSEIFGFYNGNLVIDDSAVEIPDVLSITGNMLMRRNGDIAETHTFSHQQFALFRLAPEYIGGNTYYTRNNAVTDANQYISIDTSGRPGLVGMSDNTVGVRPYFLIGVSEEEE